MGFPVLKKKTVLKNRWKVLRKLAEGGFGAVYEAFDQKTKLKVALKVESTNQPNPVLKMETIVMLRLRGKTDHVCGIVGSGVDKKGHFNFIVMNLVGPSLSTLHKSMPGRKFSESTVIRLGLQCLQGIEQLHSIGFLHRDIKPANFAIGRKSRRRIVCLLDFGLARYFRTQDENGKRICRPPREKCSFRGTVRYASLNAHDGVDWVRHDDLWSLFYMLIDFYRGKLPWHDVESDAEVAEMKRSLDVSELVDDDVIAEEFTEIHNRLKGKRSNKRPKYEWYRERFREIQKRKHLAKRGIFEWEDKEDSDQ